MLLLIVVVQELSVFRRTSVDSYNYCIGAVHASLSVLVKCGDIVAGMF